MDLESFKRAMTQPQDLNRTEKQGLAVYARDTKTSNPMVVKSAGPKTIVPEGSEADQQISSNNRYTFLMKNTPKGETE